MSLRACFATLVLALPAFAASGVEIKVLAGSAIQPVMFEIVPAFPQMAALLQADKVVRDTRLDLGQTGIGVFVRKGFPQPDISSVDAFKRAMLAAKSIGFNDPAAGAPVGIYLLGLFERLGV